MHPKLHLAITSAKSEAIMWNMADWSKQKVLNDVTLRRVRITKKKLIYEFILKSLCPVSRDHF